MQARAPSESRSSSLIDCPGEHGGTRLRSRQRHPSRRAALCVAGANLDRSLLVSYCAKSYGLGRAGVVDPEASMTLSSRFMATGEFAAVWGSKVP